MDIACRLSRAVFLMSIRTFTEIAIGRRKVGLLRNLAPSVAGPTPRVSVVLSALNEAGTIVEPALRSLLAPGYFPTWRSSRSMIGPPTVSGSIEVRCKG